MKRIIDWSEEIFLTFVVLLAFSLPSIFSVSNQIEWVSQSNPVNFDNVKYYFLMRLGNIFIGVVLAFLALRFIRRYTKNQDVNKGKLYHDHSFVAYWFCAKILGYGKCSLIQVPIYMQFKLVIKDVFDTFDVGDEDTYRILDNEEITVMIPDGVFGKMEVAQKVPKM